MCITMHSSENVNLLFPYFLFSVSVLIFRYSFSVFRSREIAEYPKTLFHVMVVIVAIVVTIVFYLFHKFLDWKSSMTICPVSFLMKYVDLHVRSLSPLLHTSFCPLLPYFPSFTPVCYTRFCFNATYEFTPPPNLRPVILGSKLLAGLFPFICLLYYGIFLCFNLRHLFRNSTGAQNRAAFYF
jgi:hypothetical protein